jgi:CubicO group peptidase (beta-lactamase class C family)/predicted dienelactone hydrolase
MIRRLSAVIVAAIACASAAIAQSNRIDTVTPSAPELAAYGPFAIGVRTLQATDRNRPDVLNIKEGGPVVRYDRTLTLEVWYPAALGAGQKAGGDYRAVTRDPAITATLHGQAVRDAAPLAGQAPFPLVIVSHGYPGNRYLMSHLAENLASKGFVAVSIDHKDSTYDDQKAFASTLYNRPFDQLFVLNEMERLGKPGSGSFLTGRLDAGHAGIVGYSMGGYGVVNVIGGGYSKASETLNGAPPNRMLADRGAGNPEYRRTIDPRIKAAIAIAPWGMVGGFWDADGLKGITTPVLFVAGSVDDVAGYEKGTKAIYQAAVNADRYLLTFVNANHNAAAPIPAPAETYASQEPGKPAAFAHYADAVWDTVRMNNILDHFATAYFDVYLKGDREKQAYFEGWKGFKRGTTAGLTLEHALPPPFPRAAPASVGLAPAPLEAATSLLNRAVAEQKIAGAVAAVARHGKLAYLETVGVQSLETRTPMTEQSLFRIYSMTKPVTAAAVMMLHEEGRFTLRDPVSKYLPEFSHVRVAEPGGVLRAPSRAITVEDLLLHTSGLSHRTSELYRTARVRLRTDTLPQFITKITRAPLMEDPGTRFRYSEATTVLGRLVEIWSAQPLDAFLEKRIFRPLRMSDTGFYVRPDERGRLVTVYQPAHDGGLAPIESEPDAPFTAPPALLEGAVGLVSTVRDFLRFSQMLLNRGELDGVRLLRADTVDSMTANGLPESVLKARGGRRGWGLGNVDVEIETGEYGWDGTAGTIFTIDPRRELISVLMWQTMPADPDGLRARFKALVDRAIVN